MGSVIFRALLIDVLIVMVLSSYVNNIYTAVTASASADITNMIMRYIDKKMYRQK